MRADRRVASRRTSTDRGGAAVAQLGKVIVLPTRNGGDLEKFMTVFGKGGTAHTARSAYFGCAFDLGAEGKSRVDSDRRSRIEYAATANDARISSQPATLHEVN